MLEQAFDPPRASDIVEVIRDVEFREALDDYEIASNGGPDRSAACYGNHHRQRCPVFSGAAVGRCHALRAIGEQDRTGWLGKRTVNKAEMGDRMAARTGVSKSAARETVDGVFAVIGDVLADGEEVRIAGFGTFGTRSRPALRGRNPRAGEAISKSASTSPTFKAGQTLKDAVNAGPAS